MTAHEQMRAMLDELMGTSRDGENSHMKVKFDDQRVCKSFLLGCCPHDILSSTRMDLGECRCVHDLALRADYEQAALTRDYYYDVDAMEHLQNFVTDCDRKTEVAKRRLKETQEELSEEANSKVDKIHQLGEQIGTRMAMAEEMGAEGLVEESLKLLEEIDVVKKKKVALETEFRNTMPASSYQQQKLRVCEVCGAYLGIHDNDRRLADHFGGKLHLGFITIRSKLLELLGLVADRRILREIDREELRRKRDLEDKEMAKQRERSVSRDRNHSSKEKDHGHRHSSKSKRSRSRSRERRRHSGRSKDHHSDSHRRRCRSRSHRSRSGSRSNRNRTGHKSYSRSKRSHSSDSGSGDGQQAADRRV